MPKVLLALAAALMMNHNPSKTDWHIRPARMDDASGVQTLLKKSYHKLLQPDYNDDILTKALPLITGANEELLTCGTWYVAEHPETKQIVGCGGWTRRSPLSKGKETTPQEDDKEEPPHLRHFACDPDFTRSGIASAIWQRSLADMSTSYQDSLPSLEVFSTLTAVPFYRSLGFEEVKPVEIPLQQGIVSFPAMLMRREKSYK